MTNNSSPCEFSSDKLLILAAIVMATALLFYSISVVFAMTPDMFVQKMEEEIGNGTSNYTSNAISSYVDQIQKAIGND